MYFHHIRYLFSVTFYLAFNRASHTHTHTHPLSALIKFAQRQFPSGDKLFQGRTGKEQPPRCSGPMGRTYQYLLFIFIYRFKNRLFFLIAADLISLQRSYKFETFAWKTCQWVFDQLQFEIFSTLHMSLGIRTLRLGRNLHTLLQQKA